jgi:hypothetical protein
VIAASNCDGLRCDILQIVNEAPVNKRGGVATVAEALHRGLLARGVRSLLAVVDHPHTPQEIRATLDVLPQTMFATTADLARVPAAVSHAHAYRYDAELLEHVRRSPTVVTVHSFAAVESAGLPAAFRDDVAGQVALIEAAAAVALVSNAELDRYRRLG